MTKSHVVVLCTLMLASCPDAAGSTERTEYPWRQFTPPPGSPTPTPARMTFSSPKRWSPAKAETFGGLLQWAPPTRTARRLRGGCRGGVGGHTWHAYLSTQARPGQPAVNELDRIGIGPWFNRSFAQLWAPQKAIISADLAELHVDTLVQAQRGSNLFKQSTRNEHGQVIHGIGDTPPIQHEILTGSKWDGRAYMDITPTILATNWTSSSTGSSQVGHSDRIGNGS